MAQPLWSTAQQQERAQRVKHRSLFRGDHEYILSDHKNKRIKRPYVTYNVLGDVLTRKVSELVFPSLPTITVGSPSQQEAVDRLITQLNLEELCAQTALTVSYASTAWWKVGWDGDGPVVLLWGNNGNEYVTYEGPRRRPHAVTCWYFVGEGDHAVAISERHIILPGLTSPDGNEYGPGLSIVSTAWQVSGGVPMAVPVAWERVPWPSTVTPPPQEIYLPGIDTLPMACIANLDLDGDGEPDSDYTPSLISIQTNINKVLSIRQGVVDYCEFPAITMSESILEDGAEGAEISFDEAKFNIVADDGSAPKTKIRIEGWTGNLENSGAQYEYYVDAFHKLSGISKALFGESLSGADSGYARRLALMGLEKGITSRRARYESPMVTILRAAMQLERYYGISDVEPIESATFTWESIIPPDTDREEQRVTRQSQAGVRSLFSTVAKLNPEWGTTEILEECERILADNQLKRVAVMGPDGEAVE